MKFNKKLSMVLIAGMIALGAVGCKEQSNVPNNTDGKLEAPSDMKPLTEEEKAKLLESGMVEIDK
ncbi:hypothetical protein CHL78_013995 [Romboutsia weinsteinii]|uniref:Uncharacterized protein n=1 Tax=Romboutsia weinsteinii TaxID=2020949 RepID=A0A255I5V5_9FIRM|nr:hypothetical protein [Romboutsia weinsteinii]RDY26289.1 hypothetical protein CHL78_013995 [Romboutsia weinsteinii]